MIFNNFSARSFNGRAKIITLVIIFVLTSVIFAGVAAIDAQALVKSRRNFLRTSYNPEYYSLFEISGNTLYAKGRYVSDRVKRLFFAGAEEAGGSYKIKIGKDGSYEAELTLPEGYRYTSIAVQLTSGAIFGYRIYCDNGFYFADNGLSEANRTVFDNIIDASPESAGYYISKTADAEEIAAVQEQIKRISDSVTDGIENDYEKARALAVYVSEHFYYDHDARAESVTESEVVLYEVLKKSRTVCTGFADLYCALLQAQGIDAVNIKGGSTGGEVEYENLTDGVQNHEFTAFYHKAEERWVWVDSCWNGSGDYKNGEYLDKNAHEKYFDISDEALALDHRADYAERRLFFEAKAAEPEETEETTAATTVVTTASVTETSSEETTAAPAVQETTAQHPAEKEDNTGLVIIAAILGVLVIGAGVAVVVILRGNKSR
ncbi:MAG: transglutaminase domain-containing protein [Oscillospiraceae bacterium]|nr:transglutaminase domain-containing protein [Oscillospiraceae bacterium]